LDGVFLFCNLIGAALSGRNFLSYFYIVSKGTGDAESGRIVVEKGGLNEENQ
jgi:hypothetical protein